MEFEHFLQKIIKKLKSGILIQGTLSNPRIRSKALRRVGVRSVEIKSELCLQFSYEYDKKTEHENLPLDQIDERIKSLFRDFRQFYGEFEESSLQIQISKKFKVRWQEKTSEKKRVELLHDRRKNYLIEEGRVYPFLVRLGLQTEEGKVRVKYYDKFRQINRFLEFIDDSLEFLPEDEEIRILDFGSGKSYLTFALYHYLREEKGLNIRVTGLDLKRDVINKCSRIAKDLSYEGLNFEVGNIHDYKEVGKVHMVVTLHACDVATDMALAQAVRWGAKVILSVPCCQHELRNQIESEELQLILKHGLMKEEFSSLATDTLRAELLSLLGYETQLLEFISMEHTPKNTLIRAFYRGRKARKEEVLAYKKFRDLLSAKPFLEGEIGSRIKGL